ncbi:TRAFAC clade GTPase domain-containing protein [Burkholderia cepacia]|uniref:TRAFAC clade GTPase domain-containing protein n=1 Tax=Burkholderia cepacia TaxID=292 RepID=UPI001C933DCD|nr:hypothetical protein [Burkholderia cepacia]MBY4715492.1 hypothetical protein [Burkholderia cepacia]MBY4741449.1 hypothetical protein [Burkholderia cepacia]MBY4748955.1 hypothetical protein [Burkholderia cepacia]MBY4758781.1 hypothetical protein [Burkholderia cepacia]MBY4779140.1 hypothetical protein [Burkholderia cepacia]
MERDPATCENRIGTGRSASVPFGSPTNTLNEGGEQSQTIGAPVLESTENAPAFPASTTLGLDVVSRLMRSRYVTGIGILGESNSGKTACLVSLYLLVSNGFLRGWAFADSASLTGFEDIARAARVWNDGQPPDQITLHTEMADDRQPGLLHLRLKRKSDGKRVDITLPDLPGEWTEALIKSSRSDRLEFMRSAETVWLVVDGRSLRELRTRQGAITRLGELLGRLEEMTKEYPPKVLVVVTHRDKGALDKSIRDRLQAEIGKRILPAEIVEVAPVAEDDKICKSGFGIEALLDASIGVAPAAAAFWTSTTPVEGARAYLGYRRDR